MPREYESKQALIEAETGLILVEQPHGTVAYDHGERKPKKVIVDGEEAHDLLMLDAMTMGVLKQMMRMRPENRDRFLEYSWATMGKWAWECVNNCSTKRTVQKASG